LPGKTLLVQPAGIEAGNTSPKAKAKELGNHLDMVPVNTHEEMFAVLADPLLLEYDNIYIDGVTAFTELVYNSKMFAAVSAKDKWAGFDYIRDQATKLVVAAKALADNHNKNVFITYALKEKRDESGNITAVEMDAKGNATKSLVEGKCPNVLALVAIQDPATGEWKRKLITSNLGPYVARLGNFLDADNPKKFDDDLSKLLEFVKRA
jgi:hypothetical protein